MSTILIVCTTPDERAEMALQEARALGYLNMRRMLFMVSYVLMMVASAGWKHYQFSTMWFCMKAI